MLKKLLNLSALLSLFILTSIASASRLQDGKSILSDTPASSWEDAMVTGNGLIGVMQHGIPLNETFTFNCHKFILPNGAPFPIPDMSDMVKPMQDLMLDGKIGEGWAMYLNELFRRQGAGLRWTQSYHPGYVMNLKMEDDGEITNYSRVTDYQTGEIIVKWTDNRGDWVRKTFSSRKDNVIVTQLLAPKDATLSCVLSCSPAPICKLSVYQEGKSYATMETLVDDNFIDVRTTYPEINGKQGGYEGVTKVVIRQGKKIVAGEILKIEDAKEVLLLTKLDRYKDDCNLWDNKLLQIELDATIASYSELLARHVAIHKELFNRVGFTLFGNKSDLALSTERLLKKEYDATDTIEKALLEKLFYTSRYLFISSCSNQYGPRLTGMFLGAWGAAWAGDYTGDANVNLAVMGGGIADLPECMEGYFQIIERSLPQWREGARQLYGCRGILGLTRMDGEVGVPLHVSSYHACSAATGLGPWLIYPMYEHYQITGDQDFLRTRLYPLLKEQVWFYEDFLTHTDKNGKFVFVPSCSPENAWEGVQPRTSAAINATMDIAAAKHAIKMILDVEKDLGIGENTENRKWKEMLAKMPPYLVNNDGALQEWSWSGHGENYKHRHSSHMYTVWPSYDINLENPETAHLVTKVSKALDMRTAKIVHAHDALMKSIARIRVKESDELYKNMKYLLENKYFYTSLASSHDSNNRIYNYDLILTLQGLLVEMAVFTDNDVIELLPAMPEQFDRGQLSGIKGRNQTTFNNLEWDLKSHTITCEITSHIDQMITLIHRNGIKKIKCNAKIKSSDLGEFAKIIEFSADKPTKVVITF